MFGKYVGWRTFFATLILLVVNNADVSAWIVGLLPQWALNAFNTGIGAVALKFFIEKLNAIAYPKPPA